MTIDRILKKKRDFFVSQIFEIEPKKTKSVDTKKEKRTEKKERQSIITAHHNEMLGPELFVLDHLQPEKIKLNQIFFIVH